MSCKLSSFWSLHSSSSWSDLIHVPPPFLPNPFPLSLQLSIPSLLISPFSPLCSSLVPPYITQTVSVLSGSCHLSPRPCVSVLISWFTADWRPSLPGNISMSQELQRHIRVPPLSATHAEPTRLCVMRLSKLPNLHHRVCLINFKPFVAANSVLNTTNWMYFKCKNSWTSTARNWVPAKQ